MGVAPTGRPEHISPGKEGHMSQFDSSSYRKRELRRLLRMTKRMREENTLFLGTAEVMQQTMPTDEAPLVEPDFRAALSCFAALLDQQVATLTDMLADRLPLDTQVPECPPELLDRLDWGCEHEP
jgi:hypothetical protein